LYIDQVQIDVHIVGYKGHTGGPSSDHVCALVSLFQACTNLTVFKGNTNLSLFNDTHKTHVIERQYHHWLHILNTNLRGQGIVTWTPTVSYGPCPDGALI